ncbi:MAG: twin-arginine translocase TatA/TatE family subunit [Planctomycetes bacterium]|nr:twin-arginine translocase TatA/TatE family subunit [Planctomycetota bacterium]
MNIPVTILAFGMPGGTELAVILVIALLIFGRRLPSIMRSLGGSMREFKKGVNEGLDEDEAASQEIPGTSSREKTSATESGDVDANSAETEATPLKDDNEDQQRSL